MLRNFITLAFRNLKRKLIYSLINILGLALGLAGSYVISNWVLQELSFDKHFEDSEKIYRVSVSFYNSGAFASGPEVLNNTLNELAPEVEQTTRLDRSSPTTLYVGDNEFKEPVSQADSNFFMVFSYDFEVGNPKTCLSNPSQIVMDTRMAQKIFGTTDILGKTLEIGEDKKSFIVSGVVKFNKHPTHIDASIWIPLEPEHSSNWTSARVYNYVKLQPEADKNDLVQRLESIKKDLVYPRFDTGVPYNEWKSLDYFDFHVVGLEEIHLHSDMRFEMKPGGNKANVYVFTIVAIFLLLIAVINFVNLSTAQSINRAKEVGIRKALGIGRFNLMIQFLMEAILLSLIAMLVGFGLAELFLLLFETSTNELLVTGLFQDSSKLVFYLLLSIGVGFLAGIYPAFYMSRYLPINILKAGTGHKFEKQNFRNVLVIIQFSVSISLIIGSIVVFRQLDTLRNIDLGFDRKNVLIINNASVLGQNKESFRNNLLSQSGVKNASFNKRMPAGPSIWIYTFQSEQMDKDLSFQTFIGDDQFIPTMGFRLKEGRNFLSNLASDSLALILNESAVKEMLLENPIGAELANGYKVVGVISDFGYQSFYEKPGPVVLMYDPDGYRLSIKINEGYTSSVLSFIQDQWTELGLEDPINYSFLDQNFEKLMDKEKTLGRTISFFTTIAIFVSCLGLFGLAAFTANQRKKEIGIRKVLGARIVDVVLLLNKGFTKQVLISVFFAIPLSWYFLERWLQGFAYKTELQAWVFALSGLLALLIAWITVSYLSFTAANLNPVDNLRDE